MVIYSKRLCSPQNRMKEFVSREQIFCCQWDWVMSSIQLPARLKPNPTCDLKPRPHGHFLKHHFNICFYFSQKIGLGLVCSSSAKGMIWIIILIIGFLINMQVQGQHSHQWAPFQVGGLLHAWQISHQISRYVYHEGRQPRLPLSAIYLY